MLGDPVHNPMPITRSLCKLGIYDYFAVFMPEPYYKVLCDFEQLSPWDLYTTERKAQCLGATFEKDPFAQSFASMLSDNINEDGSCDIYLTPDMITGHPYFFNHGYADVSPESAEEVERQAFERKMAAKYTAEDDIKFRK